MRNELEFEPEQTFLVFQLQYTHSLYFIECKYLVEYKSKREAVLLLESIGQFLIILLPHFIYICNANFMKH